MKKTPNALTSVGRMTAWSWFDPLQLRDQMYSGMTPSCVGHHHRADRQSEQQPAAAEAQLGEGEAGQRAEEHRAER